MSVYTNIISDILSDNDVEMKATRIGLFQQMIKLEIVDPDLCLSFVISKIKYAKDISLIALLLNYGADPNIYLQVENLGNCHILLYCYSKIPPQFFHTIYYLFVLKGANVNLASFTNLTNVNTDSSLLNILNNKIIYESVHSWLTSKIDISHLPVLSSVVVNLLKNNPNKELCEIISILVNDSSLCDNKWQIKHFEYMLYSRNSNFQNVEEITDSSYLTLAVKSTYYELVKNMLDCNLKPTYIEFASWIAHYKKISENLDDEFLIKECERIFYSLVDIGYSIDQYCFNEIAIINADFKNDLLEYYKKQKYLKPLSPGDKKLIEFYFGHGDLEELMMCDIQQIKKLIAKRNMNIILSKLSFLTNIEPNIIFENYGSFDKNPLHYLEKSMVYYFNDGKYWIFLSYQFEDLLKTKKNPYNNEDLPFELIDEIKHKIAVFEYYNISIYEIETVDEVIIRFKEIDTPTNIKTDLKVNTIREILLIKDLSENLILRISRIEKLISMFDRIGIDIQYILLLSDFNINDKLYQIKTPFSQKMIFVLICVVLYDKIKSDKTIFENFFK